MAISRVLERLVGKSTGWKKAAKVNCAILIVVSLLLVSTSIAIIAKQNFNIIFILTGTCDGDLISRANLALHLLINIVSTLVLASGNFFMQILNAPSREELDNAHSKGSWLGIGVPSVRNTFLVSKFKAWCWVALLFTRGGPYFPPGASFFLSGQQFDGLISAKDEFSKGVIGGVVNYYLTHYGDGIENGDYDALESTTLQQISKAAENGGSWEKLDPKTCWDSYINCNDEKKYRDLIIVVDNPSGWVRNDMWQLSTEQSRYWNRYIPAGESNHLFFHASCSMLAYEPRMCMNTCRSAFGSQNKGPDVHATRISPDGWYAVEVSYRNGEQVDPFWPTTQFPHDGQYSFLDPALLSFTNGTAPSSLGVWNISDTPIEGLDIHNQRLSGLQPDAFQLSMKYCLAETPQRICHIGLSPMLLLSVTAAITAKTIIVLLLTVILGRRKQSPLVTLGDAVASFVEKPDPVTVGFGTFDQNDMKNALKSKELILPTPRPWRIRQKRLLAAVPRLVWLSSYPLFIFSISIAIYYFCDSLSDHPFQDSSFLPSDGNPAIRSAFDLTLARANLLANSPQLLLSFCYVAYNNLFTRMQMAREWAMLTATYCPLRVTNPEGEQFATYRLQLPYKYSLPLIAISIFLHWLLSNTIYIFVSIGDYYLLGGESGFDSSLPSPSTITLKYSALALLVLILTSITLLFVPILLGLKRMPGNCLNSGSNSLALSAACHAATAVYNSADETDSVEHITEFTSTQRLLLPSPHLDSDRNATDEREPSYLTRTDDRMTATGMRMSTDLEASRLISDSSCTLERASTEPSSEQKERSLRKLAQSKIRWGVIRMPPEWYIEYARDGPVEHLGFGVEEDMVASPVSGHCYA